MNQVALLTDQERECLRELIARSTDPLAWIEGANFRRVLNVDERTFLTLLGHMDKFGYISNATHTSGGMYTMFKVTVKAFQELREHEHSTNTKPAPDLVEQFKDAIKRKPWIAWPMIVGVCLTTIVTLVNQLLDLLIKCGVKLH